MTPSDVTELPKLPPRSPTSHKGDFGRVLVVAGSRGMSGAAVLCGSAALRAGAGLVRLAVPEGILPIVAAGNPCYMTAPLPQDAQGRLALKARADILALAQDCDVLALGPGLGRSSQLTRLVADVITSVHKPLVLDADGLNALADEVVALSRRAAPLILTPHPGEFSRLLGSSTKEVQARRRDLTLQFAAENKVVVVLKGYHTIVSDGQRVYQNSTGNPGMATAGSGDVLTGVIAGLVGQGLEPFAAAQLGAYVHGLAGDLARDNLGEIGLVALDLVHYLPRALETGVRSQGSGARKLERGASGTR